MSIRNLPPSASVTRQTTGAKQIMPAANRNGEAICDLVAQAIKGQGYKTALEIASGTGQHVLQHAFRNPEIAWQPSDVDTARLSSIDAYAKDAAKGAILPALHLDATQPGWSNTVPPHDLIILVNLLHLISEPETETILSETAKALTPGGTFVIYGPFMRSGTLTSEGDKRFHNDLRTADPAIGYKNDTYIARLIQSNALALHQTIEMPANNLAFVARRDAAA